MSLFKNLFSKNKGKISIPPIPPLDEIAEELYEKALTFSEDIEAVKVIYSKDKTKRFIILKSVKGFYKYTYEEISVCDEEEWIYFCNTENAYPAYWLPKDETFAYSFFATEDDAMSALANEPEYKLYFL